MIGSGCPGNASCQRISIISEKPKSKKKSAVVAYWMPMIL